MSAVASASLCWTLLSVCLLLVSAEQKTITAESGQDVTLTCRGPNNNITVLEWSRADLGDENVLLYHNDRFDPDDQHPSFKNRVDLQDRQMKDGDVSLILKNVTINDAGTYECRVITTGTNRRKGANLGVSIIHLHVVPPVHWNIQRAVTTNQLQHSQTVFVLAGSTKPETAVRDSSLQLLSAKRTFTSSNK
ncbi:programmed cell death 1 ligand 1-like [Oreochromis aureus]|uniref:programmed cell death 1 ligand 1-like n=1 Tax=Oreochromis aureus TaxID=47969 RepID=UPI0019543CB7|nr:programmed cell death 1 ligand 1-like [Oreochromis aureus]XP_039464630.1 programmed cell death 1 ligand 1-like [Oreochromis aureus]CAI5671398.1 unnamed protein product [Mustela putorius furo]